jgi:hypothetical protein
MYFYPEIKFTRRHEKNAINGNKIAIIRFYINATSPFRVFGSRGFGRHRDFDHCFVSLKPEIGVSELSVAYGALKLHC